MTPRPLLLLATSLMAAMSVALAKAKPEAAEAPKAETTSLLANGSFETLNARGGPANWINKQHAGVRAYEFRVVDEHARADKHSLKLHRVKQQVWGKTEQLVPVAPAMAGKTVEFEVWVRSEKVGKKGFVTWLGASANATLLEHVKSEPVGGDNDWTKSSLRLEIPEYTTQLVVAVTLEDAGTIWIDDATLRVIDSE